MYEARILIGGEPGAGKTTLFKKLFNENTKVPDSRQKSTHGINIGYNREFPHTNKKGETITASVWDFGGQDVQNYLHQYFFACNNLFILVCDHRDQKTRLDYWFEIITRLSKKSRVLLVRNVNKSKTASQDLNIAEYEKRFPRLVLECVTVDFAINNSSWQVLLDTIATSLSSIERVNEPVPKLWKPIRDQIQEHKAEKKKHISFSDFQEICNHSGLTAEEDQEACLDYLHWLGHVLHYGDSSLSNTVFIDPEWITKGPFELLREDNYSENDKGRFTKAEIFEVWKKKKYNVQERNLLLGLLLKDRFEVCYQVDGADRFLVPILIKNISKSPFADAPKPAYVLRFHFPFMPFGFFSRLVVRLFNLIWYDNVWLTGVWLKESADNYANLVNFKDSESGENIIEVKLYGNRKNRISLLGQIRHEILSIRDRFFKNMAIIEQIPCPCSSCVNLETPYFHSRTDLEKMIEAGQYSSQCKNSGKLIPTSELLQSIIDQKELEQQLATTYGNMKKDGITINLEQKIDGSGNSSVQQTQTNKQTQSVEISIEVIQELRGETEALKAEIEKNRNLLQRSIDKDEIDVAIADVVEAEEAIKAIEAAKVDGNAPSTRSKNSFRRFIDDLSNEESTLHKTLKVLRRGKVYAQSLAKGYSKIASSLGLPAIQDTALQVIQSL